MVYLIPVLSFKESVRPCLSQSHFPRHISSAPAAHQVLTIRKKPFPQKAVNLHLDFPGGPTSADQTILLTKTKTKTK